MKWRQRLSPLLLAGIAADPCGAQTAAATQRSEDVTTGEADAAQPDDDIVVTARRREESLQKVPVAVTAFDATQLAAQGIRDNTDIALHTPSLYVGGGSFSTTNVNISLRGIASPGANVTFDPSIGIYVDEVYLARNYGALFDYFDVSSVQVLRGVQGTLFGRNNTGGAVLIGTTKPKQNNEGYAGLSLGNYDALKSYLVQNLVIAPDLLAVRVGIMSNVRDGYVREVNSGRMLANRDNRTVRASALLTPSAASELQLTYEFGSHDDSGPVFLPLAPAGRAVRPGLRFYEVAYDTPVFERGHDHILTGHGQVDLGGVRLKIVGGHLYGTNTTNQDVDATDSAIPPLANLNLRRRTTHEQDSVELQAAGDLGDGRLEYVGGLYYLGETADQPTLNTVTRQEQRLSIDNRSFAGFGHLDLRLTDRLQLGGGVRYTDDRKQVRYGTFNTLTGVCNPAAAAVRAAPGYDPSTCRVTLERANRYWSYDATLNFQATPDLLFYARSGRGQKSGGFNSAISNAGDLVGYEPEIATDYELGAKTQIFDRRLRFNAAIYQTNYDDIQRNQIVLIGSATAIVVSNAARARIRGVEAEVGLRLARGIDLNANFALTDPVYQDFTSRNAAGQVVDQRNFPFQYVSRHQFGTSLNLDRDIPSLGVLKANADYAYRSRYANYTAPDPASDQPGFGMVNGRVSLSPAAYPDLELGLWVRNLTDERYYTGATFTGAVHFAVPGLPRMFGADLKLRWNS